MLTVEQVSEQLTDGATLCRDHLFIDPGGCVIAIASNNSEFLQRMHHYFAHVVTDCEEAAIEVIAIERDEPELPVDFIDWSREPGKTGRKDSYHDLDGARLLRKVRTGMVFLQSDRQRIAAGPCLGNDNQVINFINSQYMNWLQQRGWLICHAAALVGSGGALAIAGFSGGGKSTLMLHLLEQAGLRYLTNDRLFLNVADGLTRARGIPKLPRINPGTIVHNPRLQAILGQERREALLAMPAQELWELEEKYDVHISELYGEGRICTDAELRGFLVLNWQRGSEIPTSLSRVDINSRQDLLAAIMKSPGPFYQYPDGGFLRDGTALDKTPYLEALAPVPVYEASGAVNFEAAIQFAQRDILS